MFYLTLKNKIISIVLSLMVVITFMPITGQLAFAVETDSPETTNQEIIGPEATDPGTTDTETTISDTTFNSETVVTGLNRIGYNYKSVTIGWSPVENATGYQVYRATRKTGKYSRICTTSNLEYLDKNNKSIGYNKYYKVRAYGQVNDKTEYTGFSEVYATAPNLPAPEAWTLGGSSKITVSWSKVTGATKYRVYRATSKEGEYKRLITTTKRSYTGNSVTKNKRYYYKVRAMRGSKRGYCCEAIEGITTLPAPPIVNVSNNQDSGIDISWSDVDNAAGYEIFRSTNSEDGFTQVGTSETTSFTDTDTSLENGTTYYYKVRAYASVNGKEQAGYFSTGGYREAAVAQAVAWIGAKEGSSTQRKIISIYNSKTKVGKISYKTPWCAALVSAIGINTGNSAAIPIDIYCPRMQNKFPSSARKPYSYVPTGGDLTFFDWNNNKVPDHVGMVYTADEQTVKTIEGNTTIEDKYSTDGVYVRTYNYDWARKNVLSYCIPAYSEKGKITYNDSEPEGIKTASIVENPVDEDVVDEAMEVIENGEMLQTPNEKQDPQPQENDREAVQLLLNYIDEENPADESSAEESTFNAFLVFKACESMGIEACVVTEIGTNGEENSYNEILLEGKPYLIDATNEGIIPTSYIPEGIN